MARAGGRRGEARGDRRNEPSASTAGGTAARRDPALARPGRSGLERPRASEAVRTRVVRDRSAPPVRCPQEGVRAVRRLRPVRRAARPSSRCWLQRVGGGLAGPGPLRNVRSFERGSARTRGAGGTVKWRREAANPRAKPARGGAVRARRCFRARPRGARRDPPAQAASRRGRQGWTSTVTWARPGRSRRRAL